MTIKIQEAPQAPSYEASGIQVPANIATPQAAMDSVKSQQIQLNSVNNLSGGRRKRSRSRQGLRRSNSNHAHKSFIRTYNGRRYVSSQYQKGGSQGGQIMRILRQFTIKRNPTVLMMHTPPNKEGDAIIPRCINIHVDINPVMINR